MKALLRSRCDRMIWTLSSQEVLAMRRAHHGKKPLLLRRIVAEHAGIAAGEGGRAVLGDATDRHAGMLGLDQHRDAPWLEDFVDRCRDLRREMLLGLQAPRKDIGKPRELR